MKEHNSIAIIPARGGSKRIPFKNVKEFCGKPIIAYSIEAAISSNLFEEVMVSTDDENIAIIAKQYGASIPFMRSKKNADDFATTFDVIKEVISEYKNQNKYYKYGCCIYPTAPFLNKKILCEAFEKMQTNNFTSVFPVVQYAYTIWRSLQLQEDKISMWWPENQNIRSQDLPPSFHDAGQFYWFNIERLLSTEKLISEQSGAVVTDELHAQDIDNEQDWQLAELKYKYLLSLTS